MTPRGEYQAIAEYEADLAAADLAEAGYRDERGNPVGAERHQESCLCPWCPGLPGTQREAEAGQ